ncbi:MAG: RNA polymerase sigma factor [Bacillota bacterium]
MEQTDSGSCGSWEEIVRSHQRYIYNLAYRLCDDPHEAEDLTQETFCRAFQSLDGLRKEASLRAWISRIAVNTYLLKRRKHRKHQSIALETLPAPCGSSNPEKVVIRREMQWCIRHILQHHVSREYRVILVLRDLNSLTYGEIAGVLGISVGAVKSRLHRARRAFRDHLIKSGCAGLLRDYTCYCEGVEAL